MESSPSRLWGCTFSDTLDNELVQNSDYGYLLTNIVRVGFIEDFPPERVYQKLYADRSVPLCSIHQVRRNDSTLFAVREGCSLLGGHGDMLSQEYSKDYMLLR